MSRLANLQRILHHRIVAVIRSDQSERIIHIAEALFAGGITVMEVTFTVPKAHRVLEAVADTMADRILLGAGTVLDAPTARTALLAGAQFIVCPHTQPEVIEVAHRYDAVVIPGAFTPTEVLTAWQSGADIVKIFPSDIGGPAFIKALRGPLPHVRMMPTGGVTLQTAADFLRAGACALGIGGALVEPHIVAAADWTRLEQLARQYVEVVQSVPR